MTKLNCRLKIISRLANCLKLKNSNILDIGCADGSLLSSIKNKNNFLYGLDANPFFCKQCQNKNIKIKKFFINQKPLPFPSHKFHLIVAGEIIEHLYSPDFLLSEIHRLLKPKGYLLISTPNLASLARRFMLLFGLNPFIETSPLLPESCGHIRYFTFSNFKKLLRKNKFHIKKSQSDVVNLSATGKIQSKTMANLFPQIGQSIILLCQKT